MKQFIYLFIYLLSKKKEKEKRVTLLARLHLGEKVFSAINCMHAGFLNTPLL